MEEGEERAILSFSCFHKQFSAECEQGSVGWLRAGNAPPETTKILGDPIQEGTGT